MKNDPNGQREEEASSKQRLDRRVPSVLVVDDDPGVREAIASVLRDERYIVATAGNGKTALALMRSGFVPTVVLLDLWMPELDGEATLDEMKADAKLASIPVLIITAAGDDEAKKRGKRSDGVMRKPLDLYELVERIEAHSAGKRVF